MTLPKQKRIDLDDYNDTDKLAAEVSNDTEYFLVSMLAGIELGVLDDYLGALVKACYARRTHIAPETMVRGTVGTPPIDPRANVNVVPDPNVNISPPPYVTSQPPQPALREVTAIYPLSVDEQASFTGAVFEYNGMVYPKAKLLGAVVTIEDTRQQGRYTGAKALILGVNQKLKGKWVVKPKYKAQNAQTDDVCWLQLDWISHILKPLPVNVSQ